MKVDVAVQSYKKPESLVYTLLSLKKHCGKHIDTIYINFCDPWPKKGHTKRRLTYKGFLDIYKYILKEDGMLVFKTDNQGLFDFSIEEFEKCGLEIVWSTRDLHGEQNEYAKNNIVTEYEKNFSEKGFKICSAHVRFPSKK